MRTAGRFAIELLGNPRFSNARRLVAFLNGKTSVFPTPFLSDSRRPPFTSFMCGRRESDPRLLLGRQPYYHYTTSALIIFKIQLHQIVAERKTSGNERAKIYYLMLAKLFTFIIGILGIISATITPAAPKSPPAQISTDAVPVASNLYEATTSRNTPKNAAPTPSPQKQKASPRKSTQTKTVAPSNPIQNTATTAQSAATATTSAATVDLETVNLAARNALVNIFCTSKTSGSFNALSGSGVIIDPRGIILTTAHVAQYLLLKDYSEPDFLTCVGRTGSPAYPTYNLKLFYISEQWVKDNYKNIINPDPTGTGENDFALLQIAGSANTDPLPATFPYMPADESETAIEQGAPVVVVAYPAGFLGGVVIQRDLYLASTVVPIGERYTFDSGSLDVFSLGGSPLAQRGSSGGPVISSAGKVIGIIVTSTDATSTAARNLDAISLAHVSRELAKETTLSLPELLQSDIVSFSKNFDSQIRPVLQGLFFDALGGKNS